jgi:hypothetical protein
MFQAIRVPYDKIIQTGVFCAELPEVGCLKRTKLHEKLRSGGALRHNGTGVQIFPVSIMRHLAAHAASPKRFRCKEKRALFSCQALFNDHAAP